MRAFLAIVGDAEVPAFEQYISIDYSGAQTPTASLKGLRVYLAEGDAAPVEIPSPAAPNLAFGPDGSVNFMAVDDVNNAPWSGKVYRLKLD